MDHYAVLGISKESTQEEIKKAFRTLAMEHHPDRGGNIVKFQEISLAYEILSDPDKRAEYDNPRPQFQTFGNGAEMDIQEMFAHIFGQRGGSPFDNLYAGAFRQQQKPTHRTRISVSLVDAYTGADHFIRIISNDNNPKLITIKVPKGIETGNQIRYDDVLENAILIVEFVVLPDTRYERNGNDLYSSLRISVLDLIVGTKIKVDTISGKTLEVTIPPKTQPEDRIKIVGHGMPIQNNQLFGDQILLIKPFIPNNINDELTSSIRKFRDQLET